MTNGTPDFDKIAREAAQGARDSEKHDELVAAMNDRYFVSHEGGSSYIYEEGYDNTLGREVLIRWTPRNHSTLYAHIEMPVGSRKKNIAEIWLKHPNRRSYEGGVIFDPSGRAETPNTYNLWRGFAV